MYDSPELTLWTRSESTSIPFTRNPLLANSVASGSPTYPKPYDGYDGFMA